jgi:aminoglycoside phosphotransferase (APT) family kinase protein
MHAGEVKTDASLVQCLLAAQFPQWVDLPIVPVPSAGTDNALYRLGDDLVVRLPRINWAVGQIEKDCQLLPKLAPHLPLKIPVPLAVGEPGEGYPWKWGVYRWLEGEDATVYQIADPCQAAADLADFIITLQQVDMNGGQFAVNPSSRGVPLRMRDAQTRAAIVSSNGLIDTQKVTKAWEAALQVPVWEPDPVWFHGDLLPGNLLFNKSRLSAVIDFSGLGVGDPACDLISAWSVFSGESRDVFRITLAVDADTWARGKGWALSIGLIALPYYQDTNPVLAGIARKMIGAVLEDHDST